jgi:Protein of unknown function (DUF1302)
MKHAQERRWLRMPAGRASLGALALAMVISLGPGAANARAADPAYVPGGAYANPAVASDLLSEPLSLGQAAGYSLLPQAEQRPLEWTGVPWPEGLRISGFLAENDAMWVNPYNLKDWTRSRQTLAFARTLGQFDFNYELNETNKLFLRAWLVYEPPYGWADQSIQGRQSVAGNEFYNQYAVRDAWWRSKWGPLTLYVGNQIVVWGQSISFRVGDVINPTDTTWGFGFANLEQARMPQWMLHPIVNLPNWGPLSSNFIEGVLIPGFQPMWNETNYTDNRYGDDQELIAGRIAAGDPNGIGLGGGRFSPHVADTVPYPGRDVVLGPGPYLGGISQVTGMTGIVAPPFSREFYNCDTFSSLFAPVPGALNPRNPVKAHSCPAVTTAVFLGQNPVQIQPFKIPPVTWSNMQWGFRLHTLTPDGTELTALYYNTIDPYPNYAWVPYTPIWRQVFQPLQDMGMTADRSVPLPESWAERVPLVTRVESVYTNHVPYIDMNPRNLSGYRFSDVIQDMVALDLDQAYAPWLTTTGNLTANLEFLDYITLDASHDMCEATPTSGAIGGGGCDVNENVNKHDDFILLNLSTSWWWNAFAPTWTMIYTPKGNTFIMFPSITLTPTWTTAYFLRLQDVQILSSDRESFDGGTFKGQNYVGLLFQYNFKLL